jgi:hypothetical protein
MLIAFSKPKLGMRTNLQGMGQTPGTAISLVLNRKRRKVVRISL